jgi:hypothetical protein
LGYASTSAKAYIDEREPIPSDGEALREGLEGEGLEGFFREPLTYTLKNGRILKV